LPVKIVDITQNGKYEKYLYKCLAPISTKPYHRRQEYLDNATPEGLRKKLLILDGKAVGQIEYAPAEVSGYPIVGDNIIVMNCIWVLRKAKGHGFGGLLMEDMVKSLRDTSGFATIALKDHWSPWFRKWQMEKLGFKSLDSMNVTHKAKNKGLAFTIYLMWMPLVESAKLPTWNKQKFLEGVTFCLAHPLYRPQSYKQKEILQTTGL